MSIQIRQPRYKQIFGHDDEMAESASIRWAEVIGHLQDNGLVTKTRLRLADRYVRSCVEYDSLYAEAVEQGPVLESEAGGKYFNLLWSAVEKLNDRISKFEDSLLISPKAANDKLNTKPSETKPAPADEFLD